MNNPHKMTPKSDQLSTPFSSPLLPPPLPPCFSSLGLPPIQPPPLPPAFLTPHLPDISPSRSSRLLGDDSGGFLPPPQWQTSQHSSQTMVNQYMSPKEGGSLNEMDCQAWVNKWLKGKNISERNTKTIPESNLKIYVVREKLNSAFRLVKELENDSRTLGVMVKTVSAIEWDHKCNEIEEKKKELCCILNELKLSSEDITMLKAKYSKRSKKRARLRRQAEHRKLRKEEDKVKKQNINFQIDNWQKEMQEDMERVKREEEIQKEADAVLWGVTQKKTETRRQIALLSALLELRQVRVQRLTAAGKTITPSQIETFNTVIERLKKMWTKHQDECLLEEQALRGMLNETVIKTDPLKAYKKLVLQEWETALFGSVGALDSKLKSDQLIDIRQDWDQFAVQEHTVLSSTIPPGWVLPVPPSSDHWQALLKY